MPPSHPEALKQQRTSLRLLFAVKSNIVGDLRRNTEPVLIKLHLLLRATTETQHSISQLHSLGIIINANEIGSKTPANADVAILIANTSTVSSSDDFMDADMQTIFSFKVKSCILYIQISHFRGKGSAF
ncbi:uncharacterized protein V6R79_016963 [Siganus canaliculatus]